MKEESFRDIIREIEAVKRPRLTFDFQDYYSHVKFFPDHKADQLRTGLINCDKNFFIYPNEIGKIARELNPENREIESTLPKNAAMIGKRIINFDDHCLDCCVPLSQDTIGHNYYCKGCEKKHLDDAKDFYKKTSERYRRAIDRARESKKRDAQEYIKWMKKRGITYWYMNSKNTANECKR